MQKFGAYSAFFMMSAIRVVLVSSIPALCALMIYILFIGDFEGFLGFQMSLPSVAGLFVILSFGVVFGILELISMLKDEIFPEWDALNAWYNE